MGATKAKLFNDSCYSSRRKAFLCPGISGLLLYPIKEFLETSPCPAHEPKHQKWENPDAVSCFRAKSSMLITERPSSEENKASGYQRGHFLVIARESHQFCVYVPGQPSQARRNFSGCRMMCFWKTITYSGLSLVKSEY